jgi:aspartyl-tRNA(Asn)/glutamyl-tRNA(Gln) amidotransferase subunit B
VSNADLRLIIGLEVHVQLQTVSKLFCGCSTKFGQPPNTQTCPVCLGLPGALPVLNAEAFRLSAIAGLALNCKISSVMKWDRKNYFYPDLPKGYQISQFDLPLAYDGYMEIAPEDGDRKTIGIIRAHLEEDAGKSMHDEATGKGDSRIDLNRTGTPLLEIVSEPDMRSSCEARAYLDELKLLMTYLNVSDCNMQEGSLRVDANVNLHIPSSDGMIATPIVEVKNLNSFRAVERAIDYEAHRQFDEWEDRRLRLGEAPKRTFGWDDQSGRTVEQRQKEESSDYRYFPDPDLVPVTVTPEFVEQLQRGLGELPAALRSRLHSQYGLDSYGANVLVNQGSAVVDYFEELAAKSGNARRASNWVQQDVLRILNETKTTIEKFPVAASALGELLQLIENGKLNTTRARDVFENMCQSGCSLDEAMKSLEIEEVSPNELADLCRDLLVANPKIVADVKSGKQQAVGALIGQAKKRNPNADPSSVRKILLDLIQGMG